MSYQTTVTIDVPSWAMARDNVPVKVSIKGIGGTQGVVRVYWAYHPVSGEDSTPINVGVKGAFTLSGLASGSQTLTGSFTMPNATVLVWAQVDVLFFGSLTPDNWAQKAVTLKTGGGGSADNLVGDIRKVSVPTSLKQGTPIVVRLDCDVQNTGQMPMLGAWKGRLVVGGLLTRTVTREFYCWNTAGGPEGALEFPLGNMPNRDVSITAKLSAQDYQDLLMTKYYPVEQVTFTIKLAAPDDDDDDDDDDDNGNGKPPPPPPGDDNLLMYAAIGLVGVAVISLLMPKRRNVQQAPTILMLPPGGTSTALVPSHRTDEPGYRQAAALYGYKY